MPSKTWYLRKYKSDENMRKKSKQLLDNFREKGGYSNLKKEALDRTVWRTRFGGDYGPVVRQTTE
jgi:hypothetical protein